MFGRGSSRPFDWRRCAVVGLAAAVGFVLLGQLSESFGLPDHSGVFLRPLQAEGPEASRSAGQRDAREALARSAGPAGSSQDRQCYDVAAPDSDSIYSYLRFFEDRNGEQITGPADLDSVQLRRLDYETVSFGFRDSVYWFELCVRNGADSVFESVGVGRAVAGQYPNDEGDLVLALHNTFLEYVDVYELQSRNQSDAGAGLRHTRLGLQSGISQTWPIYQFDLDAGQERRIILRVDSRSPVRFSASLDPVLEFYREQTLLNYIIGGIICSILALAVYNLILYFQLGDTNYLLYFAFLFFLTGYRILFHGIPVPYFPDLLRTHYLLLTLIFAELTSFFIIRWMLVFLNVRVHSRRLYWIGNLLALSCIPTIAFVFFDPFTTNQIIAIKALFVLVLSIPVPVYIWWRGYRPALWFIIAFSMAPLNVSTLILASFGYLPFDLFARLSVDITSLAQALLLSLALADRIRLSERAHREELALRVAERTRELSTEVDLRRAAQERAESATRAREDFLANMSHEIRTPMNAILGMADLLEETPLDRTQKDYIHTFQRAGQNLQRLLNDVLDISRVDSGALPIQNADFDLHALLSDLERIHGSVPRPREVQLVFEREPDLPRWIRGDAGRLSQVLMNLLSNALKFTTHGSVRLVAGLEAGDTLLIRVRDTGVGMQADEVRRVFERFFQSDTTYARRAGGSGLGLAISQRLAELMGGKLSAESEAGRGSEFQLRLPCVLALHPAADNLASMNAADLSPANSVSTSITADDAGSPAASTGDPAGQSERREAPADGARILGVDDSEDNRELLRHYFKRSSHRIDLAESGEAAVELFRTQPYDLVLMDIQMPGMDGFETTRVLRELVFARVHENVGRDPAIAAPVVPIVALTAYATEREVAAIRDFGFDGYLQKPISRTDLLAAVDEILGRGTGR